jgi:hypothetical protein
LRELANCRELLNRVWDFPTVSAVPLQFSAPELLNYHFWRHYAPRKTYQLLADNEEIREREGHEEPILILREPTVAYFGEAPEALNNTKRMLDLCTNARLRSVDFSVSVG